MPCDDDGTVERGTRSLSLIRNHSTRRSLIDFTVGLSLHQNHTYHHHLAYGARFERSRVTVQPTSLP